jgi:hypothetical protein
MREFLGNRDGAHLANAVAFKPRRKLLVGGDGIALEEFLARPVEHWLWTQGAPAIGL